MFGAEPGSSVAPTVSTRRPEPGEPMVASPVRFVGVGAPELPAAATTVVPASVALSQAVPFGFGTGAEHVPVDALQVPASLHASAPPQTTGVPAWQAPLLHVS